MTNPTKPANILIGIKGEAVLTDLGSVDVARLKIRTRKEALELEERCMEQCTNLYRPPELFQVPSTCDIDERTDLWSLGCTIYAFINGYSPFDGSATAAMSGLVRHPESVKVDESIYSLITRMLSVQMSHRPFIQDILKDLERIQ